MKKENLKNTILERLKAHYNFTENQRNEICIFLIEHPNVLKILIKNSWLISIEEAIEIAYANDEKYSYLREFNCSGYFSSYSINEDKKLIKDLIAWVLAGWLIKDVLNEIKHEREGLKAKLKPF